jgi:hypothetical protein
VRLVAIRHIHGTSHPNIMLCMGLKQQLRVLCSERKGGGNIGVIEAVCLSSWTAAQHLQECVVCPAAAVTTQHMHEVTKGIRHATQPPPASTPVQTQLQAACQTCCRS